MVLSVINQSTCSKYFIRLCYTVLTLLVAINRSDHQTVTCKIHVLLMLKITYANNGLTKVIRMYLVLKGVPPSPPPPLSNFTLVLRNVAKYKYDVTVTLSFEGFAQICCYFWIRDADKICLSCFSYYILGNRESPKNNLSRYSTQFNYTLFSDNF